VFGCANVSGAYLDFLFFINNYSQNSLNIEGLIFILLSTPVRFNVYQ